MIKTTFEYRIISIYSAFVVLLFGICSGEDLVPEYKFFARSAESLASRKKSIFQEYSYNLEVRDVAISEDIEMIFKFWNIDKSNTAPPNEEQFCEAAYIGFTARLPESAHEKATANKLQSPEVPRAEGVKFPPILFSIRVAPTMGLLEIINDKGMFYFKINKSDLNGLLEMHGRLYRMARGYKDEK